MRNEPFEGLVQASMIGVSLLLAFQPASVSLDPSKTQGIWEGWGTSLCWMGKTLGDRADLADLLFTTKTVRVNRESLPGLGLNIVRYNAGACSWNQVNGRRMAVSKIIQPYRQMEGFWKDPSPTGWDWSLDVNQRKMMLAAKKRGANRFELFSNSPMWWMCANDNPSGAAKSTDDNIAPGQSQVFSMYLAEIAKHAKQNWGVSFTSIEPFNEPLSSWWDANCMQEGCHFSVNAQLPVVALLRSELDRRRLSGLPIVTSDETYSSQAIKAWQGYPDVTRSIVSRVNVHGYEGEKSPRSELRAIVGSKPLWLSEHGESDASGATLARDLGLDMCDLLPTAWCYWQPFDGGGWGLVESDVANAKVLHSNPKYFVLAQYSRHIRPGMKILKTGTSELVAGFDHRRVVLVVSNLSHEPVNRIFDLARFSSIGRKANVWITQYATGVFYRMQEPMPLDGKTLQITLPAQSVETVEIPARS